MTRGRKRPPGWVPQQHGAWAMLVVPAVTGTVLLVRDHGWRWVALPVLAITVVGYFLLNAVTLWLKARRKPRYRPPVRAYAVACCLLGLAVLALGPGLAGWLVVAAPLLAVALVLAARRRDRATLSGLVTVAAACLVTPVLWSAGLPSSPPLGAVAAVADAVTHRPEEVRVPAFVTLLQLAYFFGTVVYVKTMIRERGDRRWFVASVTYHAAMTVALLAAALGGIRALTAGVSPTALVLATAVLALAAVRAWAMPVLGPLRGRSITPLQVGLVEIGFSGAVLVACLLA
ncbi:YwiC-like family protein [uncultured Arsenicicoccus sp.]|uniref:YwiC-like family protein n=1 Tax=uncultured Arsenicicoccus sp. TaxID=491339 RepID=UPI002594CC78|nr:YwiC-like family protein [uncultured Arsenicicoccus sp.]